MLLRLRPLPLCLGDPAQYPRWYGREHPAPELLPQAVFGLPELHASELPGARLVAVPGCHSTAAILGLAPAVAANLVRGDVVVDSKTGVSGAGRSPTLGVHFSEVAESAHDPRRPPRDERVRDLDAQIRTSDAELVDDLREVPRDVDVADEPLGQMPVRAGSQPASRGS